MRALIVRRGVIGLGVVCIVMRLGVEGVIAAMTARLRAVVIMIVVGSVWDVFYRILLLSAICCPWGSSSNTYTGL